MQRPTGITVLAILSFIGGVLAIFAGLALVGLSGAIAAAAGGGGGLATILGLLLLVFGVLELILGYGFWTLKPWAWSMGVALQAAGIVLDVIQFINNGSQLVSVIISIAISAAIIWYLFQPHVKAAFGRPA
ncbi:MAG TPA: DUF2127 domain-containing protein [Candidatus Limnocylindria bacterium]|jgi:uncharacterized membrane protein (DUF2068 family)|nr:DUF2127 domain-containing protein [Candidatus Limnocylindria bacterium]